MKRLAAILFLLVLAGEHLPLLSQASARCSMPCCKRMGRGACCPRNAPARVPEGAQLVGLQTGPTEKIPCRIVACDADSNATTAPRSHDFAVLATRLIPFDAPPVEEAALRESARITSRSESPPTPPPRPYRV
jgi:hypothetical protein